MLLTTKMIALQKEVTDSASEEASDSASEEANSKTPDDHTLSLLGIMTANMISVQKMRR